MDANTLEQRLSVVKRMMAANKESCIDSAEEETPVEPQEKNECGSDTSELTLFEEAKPSTGADWEVGHHRR